MKSVRKMTRAAKRYRLVMDEGGLLKTMNERGIAVKELAKKSRLSEATVVRAISGDGISLRSYRRILNALGIEDYDFKID